MRASSRQLGASRTGYQLTAGLTFLVSGLAVSLLGWRGAVWIPPLILLAAAIIMLLFLRETPPEEIAAEDPAHDAADDAEDAALLQRQRLAAAVQRALSRLRKT